MAKVFVKKISMAVAFYHQAQFTQRLGENQASFTATGEMFHDSPYIRINGPGAGSPAPAILDSGLDRTRYSMPNAQLISTKASVWVASFEDETQILATSAASAFATTVSADSDEPQASQVPGTLAEQLADRMSLFTAVGALHSDNSPISINTADVAVDEHIIVSQPLLTINAAAIFPLVSQVFTQKVVDVWTKEFELTPGGTNAATYTNSFGHRRFQMVQDLEVRFGGTEQHSIDVMLGYDTATFKYFLTVDLADFGYEDVIEAMETKNQELLKAAHDKHLGKEPVLDVTLGPVLSSSEFPKEVRAHIDDWYAQWKAEAAHILSSKVSAEDQAAYQAALDEALIADGKTPDEATRASATSNAATGSSWWQTITGMLSSTGAWLGDTIKDWGPTGIIGGYAAYETVKSATKSSIPTWLIIGGIGLAVLAILK